MKNTFWQLNGKDLAMQHLLQLKQDNGNKAGGLNGF